MVTETRFSLPHACSCFSHIIVKLSIATSFPIAFSVGPSHLLGYASKKFHRTTSFPASSNRITDPVTR